VNKPSGTRGLRRLATPEPVTVEADPEGRPTTVDTVAVTTIREEWFVEDRWWDEKRRIHRRYFETLLEGGRVEVVFFDLVTGRWFRQQG